jgi:hypothetical protein
MLEFTFDMVCQRFHSVRRTAATTRAGNLTGTLTQPVFNESARLIRLPPLRHHQGSQSLLVRAIACFTKTFGFVYRGRSLIFSVGHRLIRQSLSSTSTMHDKRGILHPPATRSNVEHCEFEFPFTVPPNEASIKTATNDSQEYAGDDKISQN